MSNQTIPEELRNTVENIQHDYSSAKVTPGRWLAAGLCSTDKTKPVLHVLLATTGDDIEAEIAAFATGEGPQPTIVAHFDNPADLRRVAQALDIVDRFFPGMPADHIKTTLAANTEVIKDAMRAANGSDEDWQRLRETIRAATAKAEASKASLH